jgi:formate dehydrogenase maturation protein FdhE
MEENFPKFQWSIFPEGDKGVQIVVRGNDFQNFLLDIASAKAEFLTPKTAVVSPVGTTQPPVATGVCPVCGSALVTGQSKDGTKKFLKCSTNKWNKDTQQAEGCNYIKWL